MKIECALFERRSRAGCIQSSKKLICTRFVAFCNLALGEFNNLNLKFCRRQVNQTGDLTVIDDLPARQRLELQQLCSLRCAGACNAIALYMHICLYDIFIVTRGGRDSLYTKEFREWIQHITGCCELTDRVDCAANIYEAGCHLLCHDDVIATRHVSYIIYLSDSNWTAHDGGALELYPVAQGGNAPAARPTASLLPSWNSMCHNPPPLSFLAPSSSRAQTCTGLCSWCNLVFRSTACRR